MLSSCDNASKSEKRKGGDLAERRSDRGRVLRRAVTLFSSFQLCNKIAIAQKSGSTEKWVEFLGWLWYNNLIDISEVVNKEVGENQCEQKMLSLQSYV